MRENPSPLEIAEFEDFCERCFTERGMTLIEKVNGLMVLERSYGGGGTCVCGPRARVCVLCVCMCCVCLGVHVRVAV